MVVPINVARLAPLLGEWHTASGPRYAALAAAIRRALIDGRLGVGVRMPSERDLAAGFGVSRTTATSAYRDLATAGYLERRRGSGSTTRLPESRPPASWPGSTDAGAPIDLAVAALPPPAQAVLDAFRLAAERLVSVDGHGYHVQGLPSLREAVAEWYRGRGLSTSADQILITCGAQQAISIVASVTLQGLAVALVEGPTYPGALSVLRERRSRIVSFPIVGDGWDVEAFEVTMKSARPSLAYLIPEFQNPTGLLMSNEERTCFAELAAKYGCRLLADETLVELALDGDPPPPPLAAFDTSGETVSIGSLSKSVWGGLRVGWIRAHRRLIARFAEARSRFDLASPVLEQLVATQLLREGSGDLQLQRARRQRAATLSVLERTMPAVKYQRPRGGLSVWLELPTPQATPLVEAARRHGVVLMPGSRFSVDGSFERFLRVPYVHPPEVMEEAIRRVASAAGDTWPVDVPEVVL